MSVVSRQFIVTSGQVTNLSINSFDKFAVVDMTRQRNVVHIKHCIQFSVTWRQLYNTESQNDEINDLLTTSTVNFLAQLH